MDRQLYGVDPSQERQKEFFLRDVRTFPEIFFDVLASREGYAVLVALCALCGLLYPALWFLYLLTALLFLPLRIRASRKAEMPMRLPSVAGVPDKGDRSPAGGYHTASGMFYIGNDDQGRECWIADRDLLTHTLVLGTTGAGKTETLVSLAFNYLAVGSGFMYIDPKAAPKLAAQMYTMCRIMGRDDDFLCLNYMSDKIAQATMRAKGHQRAPSRQSNTNNPFAVGTANQLTQLLFALMPGDDGQNSIFSNNAQTLISGLMFVLVELRDKGEMPISIEVIRHYLMNIPQIDALARRTDISDISINALRAGLSTVGWNYSKDLKSQGKNFEEQYGYARAYFGRALSLLVDNYGRIFKTSHGEVDTVDIILSRRIFVVLIPSMDKDPKELKSLGQINLAAVRAASASGLGDKVQGSIADVLGSLPTDARRPIGLIVDEYAAIETPGFEILLTQGRGLGIAVTVASQDFAGIKRASEAAAEQIVSNCKVKIFMTTEDPRQTYDLIKSLAGEAYVLKTNGFAVDRQTGSAAYRDRMEVGADKMCRVDFRDLERMIEGEFHLFFKGKLIRGTTFYAAPPLKNSQDVRLAYQLKVQEPDEKDLSVRLGAVKELKDILLRRIQREDAPEVASVSQPDKLRNVTRVFDDPRIYARSRMELAMCAFLAWNDEEAVQPEKEPPPVVSESVPPAEPERRSDSLASLGEHAETVEHDRPSVPETRESSLTEEAPAVVQTEVPSASALPEKSTSHVIMPESPLQKKDPFDDFVGNVPPPAPRRRIEKNASPEAALSDAPRTEYVGSSTSTLCKKSGADMTAKHEEALRASLATIERHFGNSEERSSEMAGRAVDGLSKKLAECYTPPLPSQAGISPDQVLQSALELIEKTEWR